jgi:hypothetical protein
MMDIGLLQIVDTYFFFKVKHQDRIMCLKGVERNKDGRVIYFEPK